MQQRMFRIAGSLRCQQSIGVLVGLRYGILNITHRCLATGQPFGPRLLASRQPSPRRLALVVVGSLEHRRGEDRLNAQYTLASVVKSVLAASGNDSRLAGRE